MCLNAHNYIHVQLCIYIYIHRLYAITFVGFTLSRILSLLLVRCFSPRWLVRFLLSLVPWLYLSSAATASVLTPVAVVHGLSVCSAALASDWDRWEERLCASRTGYRARDYLASLPHYVSPKALTSSGYMSVSGGSSAVGATSPVVRQYGLTHSVSVTAPS